MPEQFGFIGLGQMGGPMAGNIAAKGFALTVYDKAGTQGLAPEGAALGADAADSIRLLYGGSVKPGNAAELLAVADVDGALVGGASLVAEDIWEIARACP